MNLDASIARLCGTCGIALNSAAPKEIKGVIRSRGILGGIVLAIPLFGLDGIIYGCILWSMYASVARIAGIKFGKELMKNVLGGFIVNVVIAIVFNFIADWIAVFGWIAMFFVGYYATKLSGIAYLGVMEAFHDRSNMKVGLDYQKMNEAFNEAGGKGAAKGALKSGAAEIGRNILQ